MGYALNCAISIPMAIILYMLTEKLILIATNDTDDYKDRVQKHFVIGFVVGLVFIALGLTIFNKGYDLDNQVIQYALYGSGAFFVLNAVVFNWGGLDEGTKIIILGILMTGLVIYSYNSKRYDKIKNKDINDKISK